MRIAVTGGRGFIGSHLIAALLERGDEVVDVRRAGTISPPGTVPLGEPEQLSRDLAGVESVVHLATRFVASHGPQDVDRLIEDNVAATARLAEAASLTGAPHLVYTESALQHVDGASFSPVSLYAATKEAAADVLRFYADVGRLHIHFLTIFDTYGPDDPRPKLLGALRDAWRDGAALALSPGDQLVDYVHVSDVARAVMRAIAEPPAEPVESYRLTGGEPIRLREFVSLVEYVLGERLPVDWAARSYRRAEMFTPWNWPPVLPGWVPQIDLEVGLRQVIAEWSR